MENKMSEGSTICSEPIKIDKARGIYLWDSEGKRYYDMFSQTWSTPLGHRNPKVIEAVKKQLSKITHLRTAYSTENKLKLAKRIIKLAPEGLSKIHFVLQGNLAVEEAMKLAINYHEKSKILYLEGGFHERSLATMGISWKHKSNFEDYFKNEIEVKKDIKEKNKKRKSSSNHNRTCPREF